MMVMMMSMGTAIAICFKPVEENDLEGLSNFHKVTQLVSGRATAQILTKARSAASKARSAASQTSVLNSFLYCLL